VLLLPKSRRNQPFNHAAVENKIIEFATGHSLSAMDEALMGRGFFLLPLCTSSLKEIANEAVGSKTNEEFDALMRDHLKNYVEHDLLPRIWMSLPERCCLFSEGTDAALALCHQFTSTV